MLANHETGAVQPVRDIALSLPPSAKLHCDAVQAVGKIPVDFSALGARTLTASAHKFGGPKGVGVLLTKRGTDLKPLTFGGHQQKGRRPGTEPVALVVGMAVALEHAVRNLADNRTKAAALREHFWFGLQAHLFAGGAERPGHWRAGRDSDDAQRVVPRLSRGSSLDGVGFGRSRVFDRVRVFERKFAPPVPYCARWVFRKMCCARRCGSASHRTNRSPKSTKPLRRIAECVNRLRDGL